MAWHRWLALPRMARPACCLAQPSEMSAGYAHWLCMQARVNVVDALPLMEARMDVAAAHVSAPGDARAPPAAGEAPKGVASPAPAATTEVRSLRGQVLQCRLIAANAGAHHASLSRQPAPPCEHCH